MGWSICNNETTWALNVVIQKQQQQPITVHISKLSRYYQNKDKEKENKNTYQDEDNQNDHNLQPLTMNIMHMWRDDTIDWEPHMTTCIMMIIIQIIYIM